MTQRVPSTREARPARRRAVRPAVTGAVGAVAVLAFSGCGSVHPGVAAVVGSDTISHDEVDGVASALCAANLLSAGADGSVAPALATRGARESAMQVLLETELSEQFGESQGVEADERLVSQTVAEREESLALFPADRREAFRTALSDYAAAQSMVIAAGRKSLADKGRTDAPDGKALAEGQRLRSEYVETVEVDIDPRYGAYDRGSVRPGGGALSVAASDRAKAGDSGEPAQEWVTGLPAAQQCS